MTNSIIGMTNYESSKSTLTQNIKAADDTKGQKIVTYIIVMLWLRFSFIILLSLLMIVFACYVSALVLLTRNSESVDSERVARLPMVRLFLTNRAR